MKRSILRLVALAGLAVLLSVAVRAEQHRATRLGSPATRFAPPLETPEDLRSRFRDEKLKPDFASVLQQWGWRGDLNDLYRAALTAPISDIRIPVGATMPFMSSREGGRAICLRNVLWAGEKPAPAYAFTFTSKGRQYRCVTPKACSNFFLEDLGVEPKPALAIVCTAPAQVLAGRPVQVCLSLRNTGSASEPKASVSLVIPEGVTVVRTTHGGVPSEGRIQWEFSNLTAKADIEMCAMLAVRQPRQLDFAATASGLTAPAVQTSCATTVLGVPAILLELIDLEDPLELGKDVTYEIKVTNQGSAPGTNIRIVCKLPPSEEFVSADGVTPIQADGSVVRAGTLAELAPKAVASWRVVVKAIQAADARFRVELSSDQFQPPIEEVESTELY